MARGEDPIEKIADEVIDPGDPRPPTNSGFVVDRAVDPGEPKPGEPEGVPSEESEEGEDEALDLPEGTVLLYDEEGQPYLGIPISPEDVPEDPEG